MRRAVDRKWLAVMVGVVTAGCSNGSPTPSDPGLNADREQDERSFTIAVIGDTPYGDVKLAEFPSLVALINADPAVERVAPCGRHQGGEELGLLECLLPRDPRTLRHVRRSAGLHAGR
jgi:hypothetical protein